MEITDIKKVKVTGGIWDVYLIGKENDEYIVADFYKHNFVEDYNTVGKTKTYEDALLLIKKESGQEIIEIEDANYISW